MKETYNKRLFEGNNLRKIFHFSRFYWIRKIINKYSIKHDNVLELGCYDGKFLDFIPKKPSYYIGYDANWENGLAFAKSRFKKNKNYEFNYAFSPEDIKSLNPKLSIL